MMKKLFLGLLIAAMAFAFTACSNGSKDSNGSAPVIKDAFFAQESFINLNGKTPEYIKANYRITSLGLNDTNAYYLIFVIEDADKDFNEITVSSSTAFTSDMTWTWQNLASNYDGYYNANNTICSFAACGFRTMLNNTQKAAVQQSNQPVYVKATDKNGNVSSIFTIPNISITLNSSSN